MYDSHSSQVDDDGTPAAAASIAGEAIRDLNHRTFAGPGRHLAGWEYPSDAYRVLGNLGYLAGDCPGPGTDRSIPRSAAGCRLRRHRPGRRVGGRPRWRDRGSDPRAPSGAPGGRDLVHEH
jgi:hypothetical protein